jgi:hypothetical protein
MAASPTIKITYIRGISAISGKDCSYSISSATNTILANSNEYWVGYPRDGRAAAKITSRVPQPSPLGCFGCSNVMLANVTLTGGTRAAPLIQFANSTGSNGVNARQIYLLENKFTNTLQQTLECYNCDDLFVQGNTFSNGTTNGNDNIGLAFTAGPVNTVHKNLFVTDNTIDGCSRICIETGNSDPAHTSVSHQHIDRNTFTDFDHIQQPVLSVTGVTSLAQCCNTVSRNVATRAPEGCSKGAAVGLEIALPRTTVQSNQLSNFCSQMLIGACVGCVIEYNNLYMDTSGTWYDSFTRDGGYNRTEWIGVNKIWVSRSTGTEVTGCRGGPNRPWYCTLGYDSYGIRPEVWAPSRPYVFVFR